MRKKVCLVCTYVFRLVCLYFIFCNAEAVIEKILAKSGLDPEGAVYNKAWVFLESEDAMLNVLSPLLGNERQFFAEAHGESVHMYSVSNLFSKPIFLRLSPEWLRKKAVDVIRDLFRGDEHQDKRGLVENRKAKLNLFIEILAVPEDDFQLRDVASILKGKLISIVLI